jgi:co-chaperonin GroES (HSP10)
MKTKDKTKKTIKGIIVPSTWDNQGNVTGVTIQAYDEKAYLVEHVQPGDELLNHIHAKVEVDGKIRERINGIISVRVKSYSVMVGGVES